MDARVNIYCKKIHPLAKIPTKAYDNNELGFDIYVIPDESWMSHLSHDEDNDLLDKYYILRPGQRHVFSTGIIIGTEPENYGFILKDKSGLSTKHGIHVLAGVIEGTYRNEWKVCLINLGDKSVTFENGDKIAQAVLTEIVSSTIIEVQELTETKRGTKGFGSSGR